MKLLNSSSTGFYHWDLFRNTGQETFPSIVDNLYKKYGLEEVEPPYSKMRSELSLRTKIVAEEDKFNNTERISFFTMFSGSLRSGRYKSSNVITPSLTKIVVNSNASVTFELDRTAICKILVNTTQHASQGVPFEKRGVGGIRTLKLFGAVGNVPLEQLDIYEDLISSISPINKAQTIVINDYFDKYNFDTF